MKQDHSEDKTVRSLSINLLPLTSSTFRLDDNLYMTDNMADLYPGGLPVNSSFKFEMPVKLEQCVFLFCRRGNIVISINQKRIEVGSCGILVAMSGSIIESVSADENTEVILLVFDPEKVSEMIEANSVTVFLFSRYTEQESVLVVTAEAMEDFVLFYKSVRNMLIKEKDKNRQVNILNGSAYIIMNILEGWMKDTAPDRNSRGSRYHRIVSAFISDVHKFAVENRSISFYADRASLSAKHFSRIIIGQTGKRPVDYIREYIALEAKCILSSEKYSIKQVSEMLNFSNTSSFTRFYKSVTGTTPLKYKAGAMPDQTV